jgi:hypothetical protein
VTSPYRAALGGKVDELHPRLRAYFDEIPAGSIGRGSGVFFAAGAVGWARPLLGLLEHEGVAVGRFARDVPFEIENRPGGGASVRARRRFRFAGGDWTMIDVISTVGRHRTLVDDLGRTRRFRAAFAASIDDGALVLRSTRFGVRLGRMRLTLPRAIAPVVTLTERFDEATDAQHVDVRIRLPLLGTVYGYRGSFRYRIERES